VTELADTLVRHESISFREAHELVSQAVLASGANDDPAAVAAALKQIRPSLNLSEVEIMRVLDPDYFVRIRNIVGGPSPAQTTGALARARDRQRGIEGWVAGKTAMLEVARAALHGAPRERAP
jgi:argininosuccinate lyase